MRKTGEKSPVFFLCDMVWKVDPDLRHIVIVKRFAVFFKLGCHICSDFIVQQVYDFLPDIGEGRRPRICARCREDAGVFFISQFDIDIHVNDVSGAEIGITKKCNSFHGDILSNVVVLVSIIRMIS